MVPVRGFTQENTHRVVTPRNSEWKRYTKVRLTLTHDTTSETGGEDLEQNLGEMTSTVKGSIRNKCRGNIFVDFGSASSVSHNVKTHFWGNLYF